MRLGLVVANVLCRLRYDAAQADLQQLCSDDAQYQTRRDDRDNVPETHKISLPVRHQ